MFLQSGVRCVFLGVFGCLLLLLPELYAGGKQAIGLVSYSHAASLGGVPILGSEAIFDGDLLTTSGEGNALVELHPGTRMRIAENSSVHFVRDGETVRVDLVSGAVVSESTGKPDIAVTTPKYLFIPAQDGKCRYVVELSKQQVTVAAVMNGSLILKPRKTQASYVLHEGKYAVISASVVGVPSQAGGVGVRPEAQHAGTVLNVVPDSVLRQRGKGAETALKVEDGIDTGDIITSNQNGRLRIALSDGSRINVGTGSTLKIVRFELQPPQTQIELTSGRMRVRAVQLGLSGSNRTVQTPTATVWVVGPDTIIEARPNATTVLCIEGQALVGNINPAITGHVLVSAGQFTTVTQGQAPSDPQRATDSELQGQIDQTTVGPLEPGELDTVLPAAPVGWHIGSLSEAESIGLIVGVAGGAAAGIAIPLALASPSKP